MAGPNPIQMQKYLSGIDYPCSKEDLIKHARKQGADADVMRHLKALPDRMFDGPNAVSRDYSKT